MIIIIVIIILDASHLRLAGMASELQKAPLIRCQVFMSKS